MRRREEARFRVSLNQRTSCSTSTRVSSMRFSSVRKLSRSACILLSESSFWSRTTRQTMISTTSKVTERRHDSLPFCSLRATAACRRCTLLRMFAASPRSIVM